jgi:hypothetical protein
MQSKCSSVITDTFEPTGARLSLFQLFLFIQLLCKPFHSIPFYLRHFKSPHFSLFLILILFLSRLQIKQQNKKRKKLPRKSDGYCKKDKGVQSGGNIISCAKQKCFEQMNLSECSRESTI